MIWESLYVRVKKYTIRSIVCEALCHLVIRVIWVIQVIWVIRVTHQGLQVCFADKYYVLKYLLIIYVSSIVCFPVLGMQFYASDICPIGRLKVVKVVYKMCSWQRLPILGKFR